MTALFIPDTQRADAFRRDAALRRLARTGRARRRPRAHDTVVTTNDTDRHRNGP